MKIITSFLIVGSICFLANLLYEKTKMTPGHITSLFVVIGSFLGIFGWYDKLIENFGYGLCLPIVSFGNTLLNSTYEGFCEYGIYGMFSNMFSKTSLGISGVIILSFIVTIFSKVKD